MRYSTQDPREQLGTIHTYKGNMSTRSDYVIPVQSDGPFHLLGEQKVGTALTNILVISDIPLWTFQYRRIFCQTKGSLFRYRIGLGMILTFTSIPIS
jgi:hypothetical protein